MTPKDFMKRARFLLWLAPLCLVVPALSLLEDRPADRPPHRPPAAAAATSPAAASPGNPGDSPAAAEATSATTSLKLSFSSSWVSLSRRRAAAVAAIEAVA